MFNTGGTNTASATTSGSGMSAVAQPIEARDDREVRLGRVCPDCGQPKSRGARRCWTCAVAARSTDRDPVTGRMRPTLVPDAYVCPVDGPRCTGRKTANAASCWPCYLDAGGHRGRKHRKGDNTLRKITAAELLRARELYDSPMSMRAVAAIVHPNTTYKSLASCTQGLFDAFARRGWPVRDQGAATAAANRERGWQLDCDHVIATGKRKGQLCGRRALGEDGKCWHHKPEQLEAGIARLRAVDAERAGETVAVAS